MSVQKRFEMDRRRFLQTGMAAGLSVAGLAGLVLAEEKKNPLGEWPVGIQSYTLREFDRAAALKRIQDLGLKYVEFYSKHISPNSKPDQVKAIVKECKDFDITPIAYGVHHFTKNDDANKKIFEFGMALGITTFSADPEPDSFDSLDKMCEEYKIAIAIHPHGPQGKKLHRWFSAEKIMKAVKDHNPLIGSCLDTGHLIHSAIAPFNEKLDSAEQVRVMGARNFGLHLKDHDNKTEQDVVFGKAALDVVSVLKALKDVKFKGYISIEYEANPTDPVPDVKACLEVFKESVKKVA
jgi:inosose dehydratase